jgi:ribose 5-phosphate isomerase B
LICGTGIGMCISANKINGIRAASVENPVSARLSREHNDANVLCMGSRMIAPEYGAEIIETWLNTPFSGDERHAKRIDKISELENLS